MINRKMWLVLAVSALAGGAAGCSNNPQVGGASADAERIRAEKSKFETENTPVNANTRFAAGQLSETEGKYDDAVEQYQAALKLEPDHQAALFRLGSLYTAGKDYPQAVAIWQRYIKVTHYAAGGFADLDIARNCRGIYARRRRRIRRPSPRNRAIRRAG